MATKATKPAKKAAAAKATPAAKAASPRKAAPARPARRQALVTGATSGIGRAAAIGLARAGLDVAILARDPGRGEAARQAIRAAAPGSTVEVLPGDLASQASV